ncbi:MAG: thiol-disulfide oxidoreductase DCC family protein [Acidimicrobiales bacterium]
MHATSGWLIFDGDCGFCTTSAKWITARWPQRSGARAIAWQQIGEHDLVARTLTIEDFRRSAWWIEGDLREEGSRAVARALIEVGGPLALLGRAILVPPLSWVAPFGYRLVARHRYHLPGATPACKS